MDRFELTENTALYARRGLVFTFAKLLPSRSFKDLEKESLEFLKEMDNLENFIITYTDTSSLTRDGGLDTLNISFKHPREFMLPYTLRLIINPCKALNAGKVSIKQILENDVKYKMVFPMENQNINVDESNKKILVNMVNLTRALNKASEEEFDIEITHEPRGMSYTPHKFMDVERTDTWGFHGAVEHPYMTVDETVELTRCETERRLKEAYKSREEAISKLNNMNVKEIGEIFGISAPSHSHRTRERIHAGNWYIHTPGYRKPTNTRLKRLRPYGVKGRYERTQPQTSTESKEEE